MQAKSHIKRVYMPLITGLFILLFGLLYSCENHTLSKENKIQEAPDLKNITLNITDLANKPAKLVNGTFNGDHLRIFVLREATADLNQDGLIDGVVIIFRDSGGSGNYRELCLILNNGKKLVHTDRAFIGDRIKITNLNINDNIITVDYMDRGEKDSMAAKPYIKKRIQYHVRGIKLEQLSVTQNGG